MWRYSISSLNPKKALHYLYLNRQVKENRYIQYFCNVSDEGLEIFLDPSSIVVFKQRLGEKGIAIIEKEVFEVLRRAGIIQGDNALIDSSVLSNNIIYPNQHLRQFPF